MREVDVSLLPVLIKNGSKSINRAAVKTLNVVGFDAQKDIVEHVSEGSGFSKNARRTMGMTADKAKAGDLEVSVFPSVDDWYIIPPCAIPSLKNCLMTIDVSFRI